MSGRMMLIPVFTFIMLAVGSPSPRAQWIENGAAVCVEYNTQEFSVACSDGAGGAILIWRDYRNINFDIYAQRVDPSGNDLWAAGGIAVCTNSASQPTHVITPDGEGGVIIAWADYRNGNYDIYAQRLDSEGVPFWTTDGVPVVTQGSSQNYPEIVTDWDQGAIIAWSDMREGTSEIFIQRINGSGSPLWTADGINVVTTLSDKTGHDLASDGLGGVYIVWADNRYADWHIYSMRISSSGFRQWTSGGYGMCTMSDTQFDPVAVSDGYGGVIAAWEDRRSGMNYDIYAQRVNASGSVLWTPHGTPVCTESHSQYDPMLIADGEAGALIAWHDSRAGTGNIDIYAQRIDHAETPLWTTDGINASHSPEHVTYIEMISDDAGGAIFSWQAYRYSASYGVLAQRIDSNGSLLWGFNGELVSDAIGEQMDASLTTDGQNGAIIAWSDTRTQHYDIYAQRIERNGYWGYPAPMITGIRDIPGDQGGQLNLAFAASRLDVYPENSINYYTVWQAIDETAAISMLESGAVKFEETINTRNTEPDAAGALMFDEKPDRSPVIRLGTLAGEPYYWYQVAYVYDSDYIDHYAVIVPTLFDSTGVSDERHYFQVIAHESDPTKFWISPVDSGYSVDNLAPTAPLGLAGEQSYTPEGLELTWDPNIESDLVGYKIYRGTSSGFTPGAGNFVTSTPDTMTLDGDWSWEAGYWYKVSAIDIHGNESLFAVIGPDMVTGDDPMPVPDATFLSQNYPNPFNPITTIGFGIREQGFISLRIYDAAGRLVATLIDESRPAGRYTAEWNGRGTDGRAVSSGVYFYRLTTQEFEETKKMILLR